MRVFGRIRFIACCAVLLLFCVPSCARPPSPEQSFAYAEGDFSATVCGTVTRLLPDGYTGNPALIGDRLTGMPRSFEAVVAVHTDAAGYRVETVAYSAPVALGGMTVTRTTAPASAEPASQVILVRGEISMDLSEVSEKITDALLCPLELLLPVGDIATVSPTENRHYTVTRRTSEGAEAVFAFTEDDPLPLSVTFTSDARRVEGRIQH